MRGAIGGEFGRSSYYRAYYAQTLPQSKTLEDRLTMSGTLRISGVTWGGMLFGWFNSQTSFDWRTPDYLGIRVDGEGDNARLYAEYGTKNVFARSVTGGSLAGKRVHDWSLEYLPDQGTWGAGLLRLTLAGVSSETSLRPEHRADGATFDRLGLLNMQLDGSPMKGYVSNLILDGEPIDLTADPQWEGSNNSLRKVPDCVLHGRHRFGYSGDTQFAGGGTGEIGGLVWRSEGSKAYYADTTAALGFDDVLYAEGSIALERASVDSNMFIGWFNTASDAPRGEGVPTNILAAGIGGPSESGFRLYPVYHSSGDKKSSFSDFRDAPRLTPKHHVWRWWICYLPAVDPHEGGRLTVGLEDPAHVLPTSEATIPVTKSARETGAVLNRFGIRNAERGGHSVTVYLDDIRYTVGPGDVAPADRCGG